MIIFNKENKVSTKNQRSSLGLFSSSNKAYSSLYSILSDVEAESFQIVQLTVWMFATTLSIADSCVGEAKEVIDKTYLDLTNNNSVVSWYPFFTHSLFNAINTRFG